MKTKFIIFKYFLLVFCLISCLSFSACKEKTDYTSFVSDLRENVYFGESENYSIKATFSVKETPFVNDGKVGDKRNRLVIKLLNLTDTECDYTAIVTLGEKKFESEFSLNPLKDCLTAVIETPTIDKKEFPITITCGDKSHTVILKSIVPQDTLTCKEVLDTLSKSQPDLFKKYFEKDSETTAEIYLRIIIENEKAYWYVGIASGNDNLKAFLVEGKTGEVLAIRDIF